MQLICDMPEVTAEFRRQAPDHIISKYSIKSDQDTCYNFQNLKDNRNNFIFPQGIQSDSGEVIVTLLNTFSNYNTRFFKEKNNPSISKYYEFNTESYVKCFYDHKDDHKHDTNTTKQDILLVDLTPEYLENYKTLNIVQIIKRQQVVAVEAKFPNEEKPARQLKYLNNKILENKYLIIQLKRYTEGRDKINEPINMTIEIKIDNIQFRLRGYVLHIGSTLNGGHYTYYHYDYNNENHNVTLFDDNNYTVQDDNIKDANLKLGYIYLYERY